MIQLYFGVNQLKIGKPMGVLHSFVLWNHVKYANMEDFTETVTYCYQM